MTGRICPSCGRRYKGLARYCTKCGVELVKDKNRCSKMLTQLCRDAEFEEDDVYCCYCGSLTTFAEERMAQGEPVTKGRIKQEDGHGKE